MPGRTRPGWSAPWTQGRSAAHWAAFKGELDILKLLARFGTDLDLLDASRCTPLHRAVQGSQGGVLGFLVEQGVDPLAKNAEGLTCIDLAQAAEDPEVHRVLSEVLAPRGIDAGRLFGLDVEEGGRGSVEKQKLLKQRDAETSMRKVILKYYAMLAWIACVSFAVFEYTMDARQIGWRLMPFKSFAFEFGVTLSLALFVYVKTADPGRIRTPPFDRAPGVEGMLQALRDGKEMDAGRLCTTTWVLKDLRTTYCAATKACVREFDHYSDLMACAVGQLNHRPFCMFLLVHPMAQACHLWILAMIAMDSTEGIGWPQSFREYCTWHLRAAWEWPLMAMVSIVHGVGLLLAMHALGFQTFFMCVNITGDEATHRMRYAHFWVDEAGRRRFVSPFCKGSFYRNVVDFWYDRRRSEMGPSCPQKVRELAQALREAGAQ
mmetsp:Transcript_112700/g.351380  ORF Transcript_112700/g.351380 Transcript_112700/m.351380 type:complete len:433 (+) Transcript_112700:197-1495(+)